MGSVWCFFARQGEIKIKSRADDWLPELPKWGYFARSRLPLRPYHKSWSWTLEVSSLRMDLNPCKKGLAQARSSAGFNKDIPLLILTSHQKLILTEYDISLHFNSKFNRQFKKWSLHFVLRRELSADSQEGYFLNENEQEEKRPTCT